MPGGAPVSCRLCVGPAGRGGLAEASAETSASVNEPPFRWIEMGVFLLRSRFPACLVLMAAARWLKAPVAFAEPRETRTRTPLCCDPGTGRWQDTRLSWVRVQSRPQVGCPLLGGRPSSRLMLPAVPLNPLLCSFAHGLFLGGGHVRVLVSVTQRVRTATGRRS